MAMQSGWQHLAEEFMNNGTRIEYRKDEIVIRPEIDPPGVFFVHNGYLKVYEVTKTGAENINTFKQPGTLFPMLWANGNSHREVYIQAISTTVTYRLSRNHYRQYLEKHPKAMEDSLQRMVMLYEAYTDRIQNLEYRYARERIAYRLLSLAHRYGDKRGGKYVIKLPIRQAEFADSINVTRETASRELGKLRAKGLIDYTDTHYVILDPAGLEALY